MLIEYLFVDFDDFVKEVERDGWMDGWVGG